jgi:group II intron reverse transcriptase/maturase
MRTAETILAVIQDRGKRGLPLERVYRLLFNRELYLRAYARLSPNKGAMTQGSTNETVDGMSLGKIDQLIENVRCERYRWTPVRRVNIPKRNGKKRPLGIPSWSDKLLQEVMRSILEAYFEPQFSEHSHGFRPGRGCHTALSEIQTWRGTHWFIEGDIARYFETINHDTLLVILSKQIRDERFLRLLKELLEAGYMEDWKFNRTLSGTPQGGVISPILSNIYLHQFDKWVEEVLIPEFTRGKRQKANPAYNKVTHLLYNLRKCGNSNRNQIKALVKQRRTIPSVNTYDATYRRLWYARYADDFILGFTGPKAEAEEIKRRLKCWLQDNLRLNLSDEKTLITHASTVAARFLGYDIKAQRVNDYIDPLGRRVLNGGIGLYAPAEVVETKSARYLRKGKVVHRPELLKESDFTIVATYQQEYRGIVQYYLPAINVAWLSKLHWVMQGSLLKTLAAKHRSSMNKMQKKYSATTTDPRTGKSLKCLEVRVERPDKNPLIARFGGISLARKPHAFIDDQPYQVWGGRTELLKRLMADECELCGSTENVEVHHIRKLADLNRPGRKEKPQWAQIMSARQRKTLVVCRSCHEAIHQGRPTRQQVLK